MADRIHSIDAMRAVAMAFIVAIHSEALLGLGSVGNVGFFVLDTLGRFSVPFFFLTSGYLYALKRSQSEGAGYVGTYLSRVAGLYVWALVLYFPLVLLAEAGTAYGAGRDVSAAVAARAGEALSPAGLLYYGDSVLVILWFLPALAFSILLVYAFVEGGYARYLLPVAVVAYLVGALDQSVPMVVDLPIQTRDAVFFGFVFTSAGYVLHSVEWSPRPERSSLYLGLAGALAALTLAEQYLLGYVATDASLLETVVRPEYSVGLALFSIVLFVYLLSRPDLGRASVLQTLGQYAVVIYVLHPLFVFGLGEAAAFTDLIGSHFGVTLAWNLLLPVVAYFGALAIYLAIERVGADRLLGLPVSPGSRGAQAR